MKIKEIAVGDLPGFIKSPEYNKLDIKPITPLRALSQHYNPAANPEDIALIYAHSENELLGFVGLLPDVVNGNTNSAVFSNSCWWVNPKSGKNIGMVLFIKAFQLCNKKMFFTDCTEHSKTILEKTGLFIFPRPCLGKRYFLRFYFGDLVYKKTNIKILKPGFQFVDFILNSALQLLKKTNIQKWKSLGYALQSIRKIDKNLEEFITDCSKNPVLNQSADKLNWIIKYPWVSAKVENKHINYPFSYKVNSFSQEFLVIKKSGETVAVLLVSVRDQHAQIAYFYYKKESLEAITSIFLQYINAKKIRSIVIFNSELNKALNRVGFNGFYKKKISRYHGYSNELEELFKNKFLQDGEGDIAFT